MTIKLSLIALHQNIERSSYIERGFTDSLTDLGFNDPTARQLKAAANREMMGFDSLGATAAAKRHAE